MVANVRIIPVASHVVVTDENDKILADGYVAYHDGSALILDMPGGHQYRACSAYVNIYVVNH